MATRALRPSLYSKRPELYGPNWPYSFQSARGIEVHTKDRVYKDWGHFNVGVNILGYRDEDVDQAVIRAIAKGQSSSLNTEEEEELTNILLTLHPWAGGVFYTRSGGEAISVATRLAQAHTSRDGIDYDEKMCGYHGWHVNNPITRQRYTPWWYGRPAAFISEVVRYREPEKGYLEELRERCSKYGIVLIFDEISSGFRFNLGGAHLTYGINPDIAVYSKAISNGYPMGAVVCTPQIVAAADKTFISSTAWSERIGFAAAIATIHKLWNDDPYEQLYHTGTMVAEAFHRHNIPTSGRGQMLHIDFPSTEQRTLFTELMLKRGYLACGSFNPSMAHTDELLSSYLTVLESVLAALPNEKSTGVVAIDELRRLK